MSCKDLSVLSACVLVSEVSNVRFHPRCSVHDCWGRRVIARVWSYMVVSSHARRWARREHVHWRDLGSRNLVDRGRGWGKVVGSVEPWVMGRVWMIGGVDSGMVGGVRGVDTRVRMIGCVYTRMVSWMWSWMKSKAGTTYVVHFKWQFKLRVRSHETRRGLRHGGRKWLAPRHASWVRIWQVSVTSKHGITACE